MLRIQQAVLATTVMGAVSLVGAPGALAQAACPAGQVSSTYSQTCVLSGAVVQGDTADRATTTSNTTPVRPAALPFTGGELVLAAATGIAALGAGTALVVAGRRRSSLA